MSHEHNHEHEQHEHEHSHCGHCESDAPPESIAIDPNAKGGKMSTFKVAGMDCADEVAALERALKPVKGVKEIKVSLMAGTVTISHDSDLPGDELIKAIGTAGLKASVPEEGHEDESSEDAQRSRLMAVVGSGIFTGIGLLLQWTKVYEPWAESPRSRWRYSQAAGSSCPKRFVLCDGSRST